MIAPPERLEPLLARMQEVLTREVYPLEERFFAEGFAAVEEDLGRLRREVQKRELWAPQLSGELGGLGLPLLDFAHVSELLGRSPLGHYTFGCQAPDAGNLEILAELATPEQRSRYLEPLARGEIRSCFAMTEPERAGSNPVWLATTAREDGGDWVLDGRKWFASGADGAAFAVVMAVTDGQAPRHERASLFLVDTGNPGFRLVRNLPVMGEAGSGWASHGEVELAGCRVGPDALLGRRGQGFRYAQARLGPGRIHHTMRWIGIAERALDLLCRHAVARELAPGRSLGEKGAVQTWIAESRAGIDAARLMVLATAEKMDREGARAARVEISAVKFFVARVLSEVLDRALQAHGGLGMTDDTPIAWFWRHERAARIYDGPDEVHREVVARRVLAPYRRAAEAEREGAAETAGAVGAGTEGPA